MQQAPNFQEPNEKFNNINNLISFQTDKITYFPGETINGMIFLNITNVLLFKDITVFLEVLDGWSYQGNTINNSIICEINLHLDQIIQEKSGEYLILGNGKYYFSFNLNIPNNISPTFEYSVQKYTVCSRYTLVAKIQTNKNLKNKAANRVIHIGAPYKDVQTGERIKEVSKTFSSFLKSKGLCKINISSENVCVKYNEHVKIVIFVNTEKCSVPATKLNWVLYREIILYKENGEIRKLFKTILSSKETNINVSKGCKDFRHTVQICDLDKNEFIYSDGFRDQYKFIQYFSELFVSTKSKLIECKYYLEIKVQLGNNFIETILPIIVSNQNIEDKNSNPSNVMNNYTQQMGNMPMDQNMNQQMSQKNQMHMNYNEEYYPTMNQINNYPDQQELGYGMQYLIGEQQNYPNEPIY